MTGLEDQPNGKQNSPLDKAGEFAKYLTALATGALVFSAEVLKKDYSLTGFARYAVFVSWVCLALSVLCGLGVLARIPLMMVEKTDDLEDKFLSPPLRGQQVLFFVGIMALGTALVSALWSAPASSSMDGEKQKVCICVKACDSEGRFAISTSAPVIGNAPAHQHTFLLDRQTGRVWDMVCESRKTVRFQKVEVQDIP